jgi:hypothetical protein
MPYLSIVIVATCAVFFWRAAEFEHASRLLWGGLSLLISVVMLYWLHWGFLGILLGQIGLYIGIAIFRPSPKL